MGLTIFKTLRTDAFPKTPEGRKRLQAIIEKHTTKTENQYDKKQFVRVMDGQGIYEEIEQLGLWKVPEKEKEETALDWYHQAGVIKLKNGVDAGIIVYRDDDDIMVNIFAI